MDFKTFFDTSRAQLRQGKPAQVKLGRVERHRPAGLIHTTPDRPPVAACTGNLLEGNSCWFVNMFDPAAVCCLLPSFPAEEWQ